VTEIHYLMHKHELTFHGRTLKASEVLLILESNTIIVWNKFICYNKDEPM